MLRLLDSFQDYTTSQITRKWSGYRDYIGIAIQSTGGRNNGPCLRLAHNGNSSFMDSVLFVAPSAQATWIIGFRLKASAMPGSNSRYMLRIIDAYNTHIQLGVNTDGSLRVYRSTTEIANSGANVLVAGTEYYIEMKVTIADAGGTADVHVNGASWVTFTGDTRNAGNATANSIELGGFYQSGGLPNYIYISDVYIADGAAGNVTDFLGDCRVDAHHFTANGYSSQLTPSTGSNYQNVDEDQSDDGTTYNESATAGHIDTYKTTALGFTPTSIYGLQVNYTIGKDNAGARSFKRTVRKSGTNYQGSARNLGMAYMMYSEVIEDDPATTTNWTKSDLESNVEWGVEVV